MNPNEHAQIDAWQSIGIVPKTGWEEKAEPIQSWTLAVAASFTAEPLDEPLQFWKRELALPAEIRLAPYNQLFQQLLDPGSLLSQNRSGVNVLLIRLEDLARFSNETRRAVRPEHGQSIEQNAQELLSLLKAAGARSRIPWIVCLCPASEMALGSAPLVRVLERLEQLLTAACEQTRNLHLVRPAELLSLYPVPDYDDPQGNELGHIPYSPLFFAALGTFLVRKIDALRRRPKRAIMLECDEVLWGGFCGEDGAAEIHLDRWHLGVQKFLAEQRKAGLRLCLCSRNNESDVAEVFRLRRREMLLRPGDFAVHRVNWRSKTENLRGLARELGLGLESFVVLEKSALACAEIQANCSEVLSLQLPNDSATWPRFLRHVWALDQVRGHEAAGHPARPPNRIEAALSLSPTYVADLDLQVEIEAARPEQVPRLAYLSQRVKQFNCTPRRRAESELLKLCREGPCQVRAVQVTDRSADYGPVGVLIYQALNGVLEVDTFLLSNRVLGAGVEHRMLAYLGETAEELGLSLIQLTFTSNGQNQPAWDFLGAIGAGFRRTIKGNSISYFPVAVAASIRFGGTPGLSALPGSQSGQLPAQREARGESGRSARYTWIAQNAATPDQISKLLEEQGIGSPAPATAEFVPAATETQRQLCELIQQTLRLDQVSIQDNFFALGMTSLMAVRVCAKLEKMTSRSLPLVTLFEAPTVEQLSKKLEN